VSSLRAETGANATNAHATRADVAPCVMSSSSALAPAQSLHELLHTVPAPLVGVLVGLGPYIARVRRALEILSWRPSTSHPRISAWPDGWLAVAAWWALCLFAAPALRYVVHRALTDAWR
jgi:hypothetical protein